MLNVSSFYVLIICIPYCLKVSKSFESMIKCTWLVHDKTTIYVRSDSSSISDVFCWSSSVVTSSCSCFKVLLILSCSSSLSVSSSAPGWCETKCSGITALWAPGLCHTFWAPCQHNKISTLHYMSTHTLLYFQTECGCTCLNILWLPPFQGPRQRHDKIIKTVWLHVVSIICNYVVHYYLMTTKDVRSLYIFFQRMSKSTKICPYISHGSRHNIL